MLRCTRYSCPIPGVLHFNSLLYYYNLYFLASANTTAVYLDPPISMTTYYHQQIPTRDPFFLSVASHRSRSDHVAMYYATTLCLCLMYVSIVSNPASALAASAKVYCHFPSSCRHRSCPVSRRSTWFWKLPSTCSIQGVTTHVSLPKISTD